MIVEITCSPDEIEDEELIKRKIKKVAGKFEYRNYTLIRKWIDARGRPRFGLRYKLYTEEDRVEEFKNVYYPDADDNSPVVHIIGAGPAGYFAALECLILGMKPVVIEQGKDVRSRRRDLRAIQQEGVVNPRSNYCFGEGGAGTYSDGKLYTRAKKRGDVEAVIKVLVKHGAKEDILFEAHPHIGSNKLPGIISSIRETIESHGGEVWFQSEVTDIQTHEGVMEKLVLNHEQEVPATHVILATGHSARPIYHLIHDKGWALEAKPFALGVRIEHAQKLIDSIQYGQTPRHANLPAADYRLACQVDDHGVFSFCMCPGGLIVPAATAPGEIVVNGMSLSRRDSPFANSGFVVSVELNDIHQDNDPNDPLAGLRFQQEIEQLMFNAGDGSQSAPAQRVVDFLEGRHSEDLPDTSYIPGIFPSRLDLLLPEFIVNGLKKGLRKFDRKMKGYIDRDAVLVGVESRTSAPVRIPRDPDSLQHPQIAGLFPCGEGAGYAGGIMSAAMDGKKVARAVHAMMCV